MRFRHVVATVVAIVAVALAFSMGGQEEPLPVVTPHVDAPLVVLAVEPILSETPKPTLSAAAHANDFATFDALYRDAQRRGENVAAYATLHELWTYSVTDPVGAFYGEDLHDRLARAYPGYANFIDGYRIVDRRGSVFYPTSETRAFLLARAEAGDVVRVRTAENVTPAPHATAATTTRRTSTRAHRAATTHKPATKAAVAPSKPAPAPAPAPVQAVAAPVVITPTPTPAPASAVIAAPVQPAPVTKPAPVPVQQRNGADRGLLLVIVGLIGIGLLALILRAPREKMPNVITPAPPPPPAEKAEPSTPR